MEIKEKKEPQKGPQKKPIKSKGGSQILLIILFIIVGLWIIMMMQNRNSTRAITWDYSTLIENVKAGKVREVTIVDQEVQNGIAIETINGVGKEINFNSYIPYSTTDLVPILIENNVNVKGQPKRQSIFPLLLLNILPILVIGLLLWFFMFRQVQGSNNKAMSFGRSKARLLTKEDAGVTFKDVEGCKEAKEELAEVVHFDSVPGDTADAKPHTFYNTSVNNGFIVGYCAFASTAMFVIDTCHPSSIIKGKFAALVG